MKNPLLEPSSLPFGATPFDRIRTEHFEPAFGSALKDARSGLEKIKRDADQPSFENTIEALEYNQESLDHVAGVFQNFLNAHTSETLQGLAKVFMPRLASYANDVYLDPLLFARVNAVFEKRAGLKLDAERSMLLEKTYKSFVRNGARLDEEGKAKLREVDQRLAMLEQQFSDHVLAATTEYELVLNSREDLAGLPESVMEAAAIQGESRGKKGSWVFTLDQPSFGPFLKFSERRELREQLWRAHSSRAVADKHDNRPLVIEIAKLRFQRAKLLGYASHAHFVLEERMASDPSVVVRFLERLRLVSRAAAESDLAELKKTSGLGEKFRPWDFAFYSEQLKKTKFSFDEEELRPYFKQEEVMAGVFEHARRLYGLVFERRKEIPVYHPEVEVYEVKDGKTGEFLGLLYGDYFPRASKQGGAWMTTYRGQGMLAGKIERPHASIVLNNTQPTATRPSLLRLHEVKTIFHEFGHALHALLSRCRYRSLAGPNVYWDFVELPSQVMENWVEEKEGLDLFAKHYRTGEKIPAEWVRKIQEVARFQAGWMSLRQVSFALLDLAWHGPTSGNEPSGVQDVERFEAEAVRSATLFEHIPGTSFSCGFSHIFSGGYSAGYYSYKWAEVLDADAFELFKKEGVFHAETARRFRENVLEKGGSDHPMELYRRFRGREPDPEALLRRDGLLDDEERFSG